MDDDTATVTPTKDENSEIDANNGDLTCGSTNDEQLEKDASHDDLEDADKISSSPLDRKIESEEDQVEDQKNEEEAASPSLSPSVNDENTSSPVGNNEESPEESEIRKEEGSKKGDNSEDLASESQEELACDDEVSNLGNEAEQDSQDIESKQKLDNEGVVDDERNFRDINEISREASENAQSRTIIDNTEEISNQDDVCRDSVDKSVGSPENEESVNQDLPSETNSGRNTQESDIESDEDVNEWEDDVAKNDEAPTRDIEESMDLDDNSGAQHVKEAEEVSSDDENETQSSQVSQSSQISQSELSQGNEEEEDKAGNNEEIVENPLSPAEDISESEAGELSDEEEEEKEKPEGKEDEWDLDLTKKGDNVHHDRPLAETEDINSPESDLQEREKTPIRDLDSAASPISEEGNLSDIDLEKRRREMYNDISDEEESFSDEEKIDNYKVDDVVKETLQTNDSSSKRAEVKKDRKVDKFHNQSSMGEEQVELDYDEDVGEEDGRGHEDKEKIDDSRGGENEAEKRETEEGEAHSDDGELDDDEDCEEGEIREPGTRKPFIPPICRFFTRGACTWGNNCRFIHPGVNDKGNYRMIERPEFGPATYGQGSGPWQGPGEKPAAEEIEEEELPPPPPMPPKVETAWERGLRHAKEQLKKANMRKEQETDFEQKRLNLSVEEEFEINKENDRYKNLHKDPYYDQYDDEYYDKLPSKRSPSPIGWQRGQYENFEVRWTREPEWAPPPVHHYQREREHPPQKFMRDPFPERHPPERFERKPASHRHKPWVEEPAPPRETRDAPVHRHTADVWHDPWRRSKSPKKKARGSRSRSRGRRRSRRSYSYSSSFSSRSRSSSYSSYSSRSSRSRSSSTSRSPTRSPVKRAGGPQGRQPPFKPDSGKPRSAISGQSGPPGPLRRQSSQNQGAPPGKAPPGGDLSLNRQRSHPGMPGGPPPEPNRGRGSKIKAGPPSQQQPPQRMGQPQRPGRHGRGHSSSSGSRSRSRSSSSGSSRSSSASSMSSISSHSSSSSSGSADSEHLYRGVGGAKEGSPVSPKKKKAKTDKGPQPGKGEKKPAASVGNRSSRGSRNDSSQAPITSKPKDPLKVVGSKQNIKLTLLNKPVEKEKPGGLVSKKRPSADLDAPPAKRPALPPPAQPKTDKKVKKPASTAPASPTKAAPHPAPTPKVQPKAPPPASAPKEKKSTSSRREELLKQLKAVEDAIARKRSKIN